MRLMTFVAGVATGMLLSQRMARQLPRRMQASGRGRQDSDRSTVGERDFPTHAPPQGDDALRDRIRGQLSRTISSPEGVQVEVRQGAVTLRGQAQARDVVLLMAEVENTAGVRSVTNELVVQGSLDEIAPPMTRDRPVTRAAERATSRMS